MSESWLPTWGQVCHVFEWLRDLQRGNKKSLALAEILGETDVGRLAHAVAWIRNNPSCYHHLMLTELSAPKDFCSLKDFAHSPLLTFLLMSESPP